MRLADIRHWVFDMDGTLTRAGNARGFVRGSIFNQSG
ncbi:hypothetical protein ACLBVR_05560, partial [Pseudomonas aeruginosa]